MCRRWKKDVLKVVKLDGVTSDKANITDGSYSSGHGGICTLKENQQE